MLLLYASCHAFTHASIDWTHNIIEVVQWHSSKATSQNSLATHKLTTRTHCLEYQVQVEFKNFTVNTALHLSYDGYLCEEMLFQLKAMFHKALYCINNLQSCPLVFLYTGACIVLSFVILLFN